MTVILFIIVIAALIFVHELGHFLVAKWSGIRVDEFALGFPPKIFSKKIGETTYALNLIPFGGYVKIFGENPDEESIDGPDKERSFVHKPSYTKVAVLVAGVLANTLFAWFLFSISYMSGMTYGTEGVDPRYIRNESIVVASVLDGSPADKAGFKTGDKIKSLAGQEFSGQERDLENVQKIIQESKGVELDFGIERSGNVEDIKIVPEKGVFDAGYAVGISMDTVGDIHLPVHLALWEGLKMTGRLFKLIILGFVDLIGGMFSGTASFSELSGPVGIAKLVGEAGQLGLAYLLSFTAFISINLVVLNLLPFPALDGGRVLFVIIEAIKGSPIKPVVANTINTIGFGLLILLMVVVTIKDVLGLF